MKFIHCADIHLGSKMEAKLPREKAEERRNEVRASFHRMVEFAKREGVKAILLAGDVFDSDRPLKRDKEFFYEVVKGTPEIDFLYLRGNHDGEESYTETDLGNLKTFTDEWTGYAYENTYICGIEISPQNALSLYSTLKLEKNKKNVVLLHGQTSQSAGKDKVVLSKLADKNIDYLALGHIHSYSEEKLDERGRYAFSGCLEGRGFDETGVKGFVLLEINEKVVSRFVPFAKRSIEEYSVDISEAKNNYDAYLKIKNEVKFSPENLYRISLLGEINFDNDGLAEEMENLLAPACYFISVKDKTLQIIDPNEYEADASLKGEFVRNVFARADWSDEQKRRVVALGLKVLTRGEVD